MTQRSGVYLTSLSLSLSLSLFLPSVSLIWAAASVLVQHLYRDMNFDSPFLLTYISTGLFILWLPTRLVLERRGRCKRFVQRSWKRVRKAVGMGGSSYEIMSSAEGGLEGEPCRDDDDGDIIIPWRNDTPNIVPSSSEASDNIEMERVGEPYQSLISQQKQSPSDKNNVGVSGGYKDEPNEDASDMGNDDSGLTEPKDGSAEQASSTAMNGAATAASSPHQTTHRHRRGVERPQVLSHIDHISMAVKIAPVWFLSNFFYNTSLASITSSTVLASTGSLFTFLLAVSCGDERFTAPKLLGVILCFTGSVLTGLSDVESDNNNLTLVADAAGGDDLGRILDNMKPTASLSTEATRIILSGGDGIGGGSESVTGDDMIGSLVLGDLAGLISVSVCNSTLHFVAGSMKNVLHLPPSISLFGVFLIMVSLSCYK